MNDVRTHNMNERKRERERQWNKETVSFLHEKKKCFLSSFIAEKSKEKKQQNEEEEEESKQEELRKTHEISVNAREEVSALKLLLLLLLLLMFLIDNEINFFEKREEMFKILTVK